MRPKLVVNEPTLVNPTAVQIARHRPVRRAQQRGRPLEPPTQQVLMRRLPEHLAELTAEMRRRQPCRLRHVGDRQRVGVVCASARSSARDRVRESVACGMAGGFWRVGSGVVSGDFEQGDIGGASSGSCAVSSGVDRYVDELEVGDPAGAHELFECGTEVSGGVVGSVDADRDPTGGAHGSARGPGDFTRSRRVRG